MRWRHFFTKRLLKTTSKEPVQQRDAALCSVLGVCLLGYYYFTNLCPDLAPLTHFNSTFCPLQPAPPSPVSRAVISSLWFRRCDFKARHQDDDEAEHGELLELAVQAKIREQIMATTHIPGLAKLGYRLHHTPQRLPGWGHCRQWGHCRRRAAAAAPHLQ